MQDAGSSGKKRSRERPDDGGMLELQELMDSHQKDRNTTIHKDRLSRQKCLAELRIFIRWHVFDYTKRLGMEHDEIVKFMTDLPISEDIDTMYADEFAQRKVQWHLQSKVDDFIKTLDPNDPHPLNNTFYLRQFPRFKPGKPRCAETELQLLKVLYTLSECEGETIVQIPNEPLLSCLLWLHHVKRFVIKGFRRCGKLCEHDAWMFGRKNATARTNVMLCAHGAPAPAAKNMLASQVSMDWKYTKTYVNGIGLYVSRSFTEACTYAVGPGAVVFVYALAYGGVGPLQRDRGNDYGKSAGVLNDVMMNDDILSHNGKMAVVSDAGQLVMTHQIEFVRSGNMYGDEPEWMSNPAVVPLLDRQTYMDSVDQLKNALRVKCRGASPEAIARLTPSKGPNSWFGNYNG